MTYKTKAIVLKNKPWPRNAGFYLLYTEKFGKVKGVAAGVQKITSKVAGHLQPFTIIEVMMAKGRSIDRLAQGRMLKGYSSFQGDFMSYLKGSYVLEIIDSLTDEGVAHYEIWKLIEELFDEMHEQSLWAVNGLGEMTTKTDLLIRNFALKLLDCFGFRPELESCLSCKRAINEERFTFSVAQGGVHCLHCSQNRQIGMQVPPAFIVYMRTVLKQNLHKTSRLIVDRQLEELLIDQIDQLVMMQIQKPLKTMSFLAPGREWTSVL